MRVPLIKDGVVINVTEMAEGCAAVTKAEHRAQMAREDAEYEEQAAIWRGKLAERQAALAEAKTQHFMAVGVAQALRGDAKKGLKGDAAERALNTIVAAEDEVKAYADNIAEIEGQPLPERPRMKRAHRWIIPEGCEVGPEGGEIGDRWDGTVYSRPVVAVDGKAA